jgi:hypothetical protein
VILVHQYNFELNDQPMSAFKLGAFSFPAFSGFEENINQPSSVCLVNEGPIPIGRYYILDRQAGILQKIKGIFGGHSDWFALYAIDGRIDDEAFCNKVRRGEFRLHPKGTLGISRGCVTIENLADFQHIKTMLRGGRPSTIPNSSLKAYGILTVK